MTAATLRSHTAKDLAQMAREKGVTGWHAMRKEELVHALVKLARRQIAKEKYRSRTNRSRTGRSSTNIARTGAVSTTSNGTPVLAKSPQSSQKSKSPNRANGSSVSAQEISNRMVKGKSSNKVHQLRQKLANNKNLANNLPGPHSPHSLGPTISPHGGKESPNGNKEGRKKTPKDRLVVMIRDPYWLHAHWELSQQNVNRARAALGKDWFGANPILRLLTVGTNGLTDLERDISIHGGVSHWYIDVQDPPKKYRLEIGYRAKGGAYYCLARSNTVATPPAGTSEAVDKNWTDVAENADRIFAMSGGYSLHGVSQELQELLEQRLGRRMGSPMETRFGQGAAIVNRQRDMQFAVDAEVTVYGIVDQGAHVTLKGEPVPIRSDGTFSVRISMPDKRQVVPIVATSCDGTQQRTIILAINRNTKVMEPIDRDG